MNNQLFIICSDAHLKIGISRSPERQLIQLATSNPRKLHIAQCAILDQILTEIRDITADRIYTAVASKCNNKQACYALNIAKPIMYFNPIDTTEILRIAGDAGLMLIQYYWRMKL